MLPRPASRLPSHLPEHSAPRSLKTPSAPPSPACQRIAPSRSYSAIPQGSPTENVDEKTNFQRLTGRAVALFAVTAGGLLLYFKHEKDKRDAERAANPVRAQQTTGKPLVGGPFSLVNQDGIPVTDLSFRGKWMLIYFGFTHCPDVCPEELERMAKIIDNLGRLSEGLLGMLLNRGIAI